MLIQRAYKTELDPLPAQREAMERHAGVSRFVWNWGLDACLKARDTGEPGEDGRPVYGKMPSAFDLKKQLNQIKAEQCPWVAEVNTYVYQSALADLGTAWANFFREMKKYKAGARSEPPGEPRFKARGRSTPSFRLYGSIHVGPDWIKVPTIGVVRLKESGYLPVAGVKINNITISSRAQRWFVSLQVEQEIPDPAPRPESPAAVEVTTRRAELSTGEQYFLSTAMRKLERRVAKLNRERDRREKGSKNRQKTVAKLQRLHYRIACKRTDLLHQATTRIARDHTEITLQDMRSSEKLQEVQPYHKRAMAIEDAAWFEFRRQVEYKSKWRGGKTYVVADEAPSGHNTAEGGKI